MPVAIALTIASSINKSWQQRVLDVAVDAQDHEVLNRMNTELTISSLF